MARSSTSFQAENLVGLKHGGRSEKVLRETRNQLRAMTTDWLLSLKADLAEPELSIGSRILADMEQIAGYVDRQGGPISTRGQMRACIGDLDRLLTRWDSWCRRNGIGYVTAGPDKAAGLAALLARPTA